MPWNRNVSTALLSQKARSLIWVQVRLSFLIASRQFCFSLSSDTPSMEKLLSLNRLYASTTFGFSTRHGPHQLAQKSTNTYLPLKEDNAIFFPFASGRTSSGDCFPTHKLGD